MTSSWHLSLDLSCPVPGWYSRWHLNVSTASSDPTRLLNLILLEELRLPFFCIFLFFTILNIPHPFLNDVDGLRCVPWGKTDHWIGQLHFYLEMTIAFILPFVLLLTMNCVIINTLRNRSNIRSEIQGQGQSEGQAIKARSSENQITVTLLVVTFSFLLLTTPFYLVFIYLKLFGMGSTPRSFATFYLIYQIGEKSNYTNNAINFLLYVVSGQKFRTDLFQLFVKGVMRNPMTVQGGQLFYNPKQNGRWGTNINPPT